MRRPRAQFEHQLLAVHHLHRRQRLLRRPSDQHLLLLVVSLLIRRGSYSLDQDLF